MSGVYLGLDQQCNVALRIDPSMAAADDDAEF
jgi:hypothetical protein